MQLWREYHSKKDSVSATLPVSHILLLKMYILFVILSNINCTLYCTPLVAHNNFYTRYSAIQNMKPMKFCIQEDHLLLDTKFSLLPV